MNKYILLLISISLFLFPFISAEDWGYNYLEGDLNTAQAINYSQLNVNNSQFLRGLTPEEIVANYYTKTESDDRFVNVDGDTMAGNLFVNGNITANTGFFDYVGSLINKITKIFTEDIEISGKINLTNGTHSNQIYTDENGTLTFYVE